MIMTGRCVSIFCHEDVAWTATEKSKTEFLGEFWTTKTCLNKNVIWFEIDSNFQLNSYKRKLQTSHIVKNNPVLLI